jgi:hypothetical protein
LWCGIYLPENNVRGGEIQITEGAAPNMGEIVSPQEFEQLAGAGANKKWKHSLRRKEADGEVGPTLAKHFRSAFGGCFC